MKGCDVSCKECAYWSERTKCSKGITYFIRWVADECPDFEGRHKSIYDWS
jgi:hypothetical protein